ncbi:MAG: T9SS type A sorting domain-containing protein [Vicingaceae bacterium]|nr:MAG: T9SS type A sorting domain-containing protein [Vicingaceae bacterium]
MLNNYGIAIKPFILANVFLCSVSVLTARNAEKVNRVGVVQEVGTVSANVGGSSSKLAANCNPATSFTYLELNNVRARIDGTSGRMWTQRGANLISGYEVPKGSGSYSIFAGALWMGGQDVNGQLKLAAATFGTGGNNYWAGPLNTTTAEIDPATCAKWDKYFKITREEVDAFVAWFESGKTDPSDYKVPKSILEWPAHGDVSLGQDFYLAPFYDRDGDGVYDPEGSGDYPYYDLKGNIDCRKVRDIRLFGDETFWWVFNDKGNVHNDPTSPAIGMEIRAQAFAFSTNDEINNMTFYNYELINRSTFTLTNTFFGQWVDCDLGYAADDYVGCDVQRGLGYAYNGDAFDEDGNGVIGYGNQPPSVGIDFFEGPYQDNDGIDNPLTENVSVALQQGGIPYPGLGLGYGDGVADNERMGMFLFNYYNIGGGPQGDPVTALDHYNYMRGIWRDGTPFTFGENGKGGTVLSKHMFPGNSDPLNWATKGISAGTNWTEETAGNVAGDRRFIQSAGPFTLLPGAVNDITVGTVWERATSGGPFASVEKLRIADDKAQALFDNCFKVLDGPDAPDVTIQELDREVIIYLSNRTISNNFKDEYVEIDPFIQLPDTLDGVVLTPQQKQELKKYTFQGYQIYQVKDASVSITDINNPDKARLVAQCDVKDGVSKLVNFSYSEEMNANIPQMMVNGEDKGVRHSFRIVNDEFATGNKRMVNHKTYYYIAVAYAYNNYKKYDPNDPLKLDGQKKPYIASRKAAVGSIRSYSAIPHKPSPEAGGTVQHAQYGDQPQITRVDGRGNGGISVALTRESEDAIVSQTKVGEITYQSGKGPVNIKVVDPLNVPGGEFTIKFKQEGTTNHPDTMSWEVTGDNVTIKSDKFIKVGYEQLIPELGISVNISQVAVPGKEKDAGSGYISTEIEYTDSTQKWLSGVEDKDGCSNYNWIRSGGTKTADNSDPCAAYDDYLSIDPNEDFEKMLSRTFAPYRLVSYPQGQAKHTPGYDNITVQLSKLDYLPNIDIVFTPDKSKWTRCVVLETQESTVLSEGGAKRLAPRKSPSVDINGQSDGSGQGMGWFPGYAIDVVSGTRLNMAFGEDSWLAGENGRDMLWNPSEVMEDGWVFQGGQLVQETRWGGKHYLYVFRESLEEENLQPTDKMPAYDGGIFIKSNLDDGSANALRRVWRACSYVGMPMLQEGKKLLPINDGIIPTETRIKIRVNRPYQKYDAGTNANATLPMYRFNLDGLATEKGIKLAAEDALSLIGVVPNPYYAYSEYEESQLDNRIKIINLPEECVVTIYNMSGTLIKQYNKADPKTSIDWDLKNIAGVPVAGGVYLIHVNVPGVGEKVIKWFGVLRPTDLNTF